MKVTEADQKVKEIQVGVQFHFIGEDHLKAFTGNTFEFEQEKGKKNIDVVLMKFDDYCM